jgi:hypothetical protein
MSHIDTIGTDCGITGVKLKDSIESLPSFGASTGVFVRTAALDSLVDFLRNDGRDPQAVF